MCELPNCMVSEAMQFDVYQYGEHSDPACDSCNLGCHSDCYICPKRTVGVPYVFMGYTRDLDTPVALMGAIYKGDHTWLLFWHTLEPVEGGPASINEAINDMHWPVNLAEDPVGFVVFGDEPGWEWDIVGDYLEDEDIEFDEYTQLFVGDVDSALERLREHACELAERYEGA